MEKRERALYATSLELRGAWLYDEYDELMWAGYLCFFQGFAKDI